MCKTEIVLFNLINKSIDKFKPVYAYCVVKAAEVVMSHRDVIGKAFRNRQNPVTKNIAF
jgi:hypothetical protein